MRFVVVNQILQKKVLVFETLRKKKGLENVSKKNRFYGTFCVKDGTKKLENAIQEQILRKYCFSIYIKKQLCEKTIQTKKDIQQT